MRILRAMGKFLTAVMLAATVSGAGAAAEEQHTKGVEHLRLESNEPVYINFDDVEIGKVLTTVGKATGTKIVLDGVDESKRISIAIQGKPLKDILAKLAAEHSLEYETPDPKTLVVRPKQVTKGN